jgi:hypothetical protein
MKMPVILRAAGAALTRLAHAIANFQARVVLTVVYFVLLAPFAVAARWSSARGSASTYWRDRSDPAPTLDRARREF